MSVEIYVSEVIEGKKGGRLVRSLLYLLSLFYKVIISIRNYLYDQRLLKAESVSIPVVSIGNIVAGGTGKTPITALMIELLQTRFTIGLISRGYRRKSIEHLTKFDSSNFLEHNAESLGDEPYLLANRYPQLKGFISKDRVKAAHAAEKAGCTLLIMDDGMQHRRLKRDYEIVVMDGSDLWGKGYFLPRGFLRDTPSRLRDASMIILTGIKDRAHFEECTAQIKKYSNAPTAGVEYVGRMRKNFSKVVAFCGIAKPQRFFTLLNQLGVEVLVQKVLEDHQTITQEALKDLAEEGLKCGAEAIFCTEKDWVKINLKETLPLPLEVLSLELKINLGKEHLKELIEKIEKKV